MKNKYRSQIISFTIVILALILISIAINYFDLDRGLQSKFYSQDSGWFLKNAQPWKFFYHYGNIPALIIAIGALLILALSSYRSKLNLYSKKALYLLLVIVVGPGLLINSVLKDNWGRPRPRNITEFDGKHQFEQVLTIDPESSGKSFPCGHASMGFYFFSLYFVFRKKRRKISSALAGFAVLWGGLIGFARIVQGGHFLSDVIWSGVLTFIVSALLYLIMDLEFKPEFTSKINIKTRNRKLLSIFSAFCILVAVILFSLATPYSRSKSYVLKEKIASDEFKYTDVEFNMLSSSDITLKQGDMFEVDFKAGGFGFPGSKIKNKLETSDQSEYQLKITYNQVKKGFFTELEQENVIEIPPNLHGDISIRSDKGDLKLYIPENSNWIITTYDVETVIDSTNYLSEFRSIARKYEQIVHIGINLSLGSLEIIRQ